MQVLNWSCNFVTDEVDAALAEQWTPLQSLRYIDLRENMYMDEYGADALQAALPALPAGWCHRFIGVGGGMSEPSWVEHVCHCPKT